MDYIIHDIVSHHGVDGDVLACVLEKAAESFNNRMWTIIIIYIYILVFLYQ